jgi:hypothetical protein
VRQNGLAPLFADAEAAAALEALPKPVQQAIARLLTFRIPTAGPVSAADVKQAFARSGLFLETQIATLARGAGQVDARPTHIPAAASGLGASAPGASAPDVASNNPADDLKAALVVLRQVVKTWLGALPEAKPNVVLPGMEPAAEPSNPARNLNGPINPAANPRASDAVRVTIEGLATAVSDARMPRGFPSAAEGGSSNERQPAAPAARDAIVAGKHNPLASSQAIPSPIPAVGDGNLLFGPDEPPVAVPAPEDSVNEPDMAAAVKTPRAVSPAAPPPPYRGAPTAAQPAVAASFAPDGDPRVVGERLVAETDAALARQTLLQAASLPDGADRTQRDVNPER